MAEQPGEQAEQSDEADHPAALDLRETLRQQMLTSIGGWSGAVITAIPTTVFVIVDVVASLRVAIFAAIGSAVLLTGYRLVRRQPLQQAISGLFGVLIAALIAGGTGQARNYFLVGIWISFIYAAPFAVSLLVRRPVIGLLWEFLDPTPGLEGPWHRNRRLLLAYTWATLGGTLVFLARGTVQAILYHRNANGWLAVARIAMSYPLYIAAVGFAFWIVRRARHAVAPRPGAAADAVSAGQDGPA
jgi:hypothetical protein